MKVPLKMLLHTKGATTLAVFSIWLCYCLPTAEPLIVPQELPSILSLIYSNIPPIKKGTDSRLGFGFRLGNHADFQVLLELGPQKNTRPIGENADSENSFNKRQVNKAQRGYLLRKHAQEALKQASDSTATSTERTAASWLESWSNAMSSSTKSGIVEASRPKSVPELPQLLSKNVEAPTALVAERTYMQLQELYRMAELSTSTESTTPAVAIVTPMPQIASIRSTNTPFEDGRLKLQGPAGFIPRPPVELVLQSVSEPQTTKQSKSAITKELMDVNLEEIQ